MVDIVLCHERRGCLLPHVPYQPDNELVAFVVLYGWLQCAATM